MPGGLLSGLGASGRPWSSQAQQEMRALRAIDFFGDFRWPSGESCRDRLGVQPVTRFLALLRALAAARKEQECTPCRLTVITCGATLDVRAPQETLLWGAARAMGRDLDPALRLDVRLVDVGGLADLPTLSWLARHDVRERALAIRKADCTRRAWCTGRGCTPPSRRRVRSTAQRVRALSAARAYSSAARQQHQASTDRYGRYGSPSGWSSRAVGVGTCQASP